MLQKTNLQKVIASISVSVFIAATIFLFLPFTVYKGNINEFAVPFTSMLSIFLFPALIFIFLLIGMGFLFPKELHRRYISILFILAILSWFQGNILVWKYGLFDGRGIDWTISTWRGWVDGTLWIVLLVTAYVFYRKIYKIARFASIALLSFQIILLAFTSFQQPEIWKMKSEGSRKVPDAIFEFSSKQNVIHIILDAFQSDIFQEIIDEDINYNKKLEGFTFFKEAMSSFPYTFLSIPAILSGQTYKNDIPMRDFVNSLLNGKTIPNALYDNDYNVDLVHFLRLFKTGRYSSSYYVDDYEGNSQMYELRQATMMLDLVLFRCAPHFLKKIIYNQQSWMIQPIFFQGDFIQLRPFVHLEFLRHITENIKVNKRRPVYKFIHLMASHIPLVMNEDCTYAGKALPYNRENIKIQSRCTLDRLIEALERIRSLGIYDSSLIIVHGDHGNKIAGKNRISEQQLGGVNLEKLIGVASTLMLIKLPHSNGPLRTSSAQVMLTDIPATISSVLNLKETFPGQSVFEIDSSRDRERRFYNHEWNQNTWRNSYFDKFTEYIIQGSVFEKDSWRLGNTDYARTLKVEKIDFGGKRISFYLDKGWGGNEKSNDGTTFNWALGKSASVFIPIPKNEAVQLTANVKTFLKSQKIVVKVDGHEIGSWELSPSSIWEKHSLVIRPDEHRPDLSVVEFLFSQQLKEGGKRQLAVLFESITLGKP